MMAELKEAAHSEKLFAWPTPQDYNEAVQAPAFCFNDPDLKTGTTELNEFGLPRPISGGFASVYHVRQDNREFAVRCFLSRISNLQFRYEAIMQQLVDHPAPWAVPCRFIMDGMLVGSSWFPILKMEWIKGDTFGAWLDKHISDVDAIREMELRFRELVASLRSYGIAHGDLQPANMIVSADGNIRLVDYDGMFVPALAGARANELGHKNFQHPDRGASHFDAELDNFSAWIISTSLQILQIDPSLWQQLNCGDDALLFRYADLSDPDHGYAFSVLEAHADQRIVHLARVIRTLCRGALNMVPPIGYHVEPDESMPAVEYTPPAVSAEITSHQLVPRPIHRPQRPQRRPKKVGGGAMATIPASIANRLAAEYARDKKTFVYPMMALAGLTAIVVVGLRIASFTEPDFVINWIQHQFEPKGVALFDSAHKLYAAGNLYAADIKFTQITKQFNDPNFGLKPDDLIEAFVHKAEIAHALHKDTEAKLNFEHAAMLTASLPKTGNAPVEPIYEPDYFRTQILICDIGKVNTKTIADGLMNLFASDPDTSRWSTADLARVFSNLLDEDPQYALVYWKGWYGAVAQGGYDASFLADLNNLAFSNAVNFATSDDPAKRRVARDIYNAILDVDASVGRQDKLDALAGLYYIAVKGSDKHEIQSALKHLKELDAPVEPEDLKEYASEPPERSFTPRDFRSD